MKTIPSLALPILSTLSCAVAFAAPGVMFLGTGPVVVTQAPAPAAALTGFGLDGAGTYYYAEMDKVVRVAPGNVPTTVAGGLKEPKLAVDYKGDVFIADTGNNRMLQVLAGSATPTVRATITNPISVASDTADDFFYLANNELYEIDRNGSPRKLGSFPGALLVAYGPATGENDTMYILSVSGEIYTLSTYTYHNETGTIATVQSFTLKDAIRSFVLDAAGNALFSAGSGTSAYVFQVTPSGEVDTLTQIPSGLAPGLAVDINRNLYYVDSTGVNQVMKGAVNFGSVNYDGRGTYTQQLPLNFSVPAGITISQDTYGVPAGQFSTFFDADYPPPGTCSPGVSACTIYVTYTPSGIAGADATTMKLLDAGGKLLLQLPLYGRGIVDFTSLYETDTTTVSKADLYPFHSLVSPAGITNSNSLQVTEVNTGTVGSTKDLTEPQTVANALTSTTYVTEGGHAGIVKIAPDGTLSRIAQRLVTEPNGVAVDDAGNLYISDRNSIFRLGVDGTETQLVDPATDSGYMEVESITADAAGNAYAFFRSGGPSGTGGLVRINPAGEATPMTVSAAVKSATGLGIDDGGGLYFSDGITRTLSTLRTDGSFLTLFTGLGRPKGVRGSGGPIVVDQQAAALYAPQPIQYNSFDLLSNQYYGTNSIDFGSVPIGTSVTKSFTALNEGTGDGSVSFTFNSTGNVSPEFSFTPMNGASLTPGTAQLVTITFTPTAAGAVQTALFGGTGFENSGDSENFIYLTGTGVAPAGKK